MTIEIKTKPVVVHIDHRALIIGPEKVTVQPALNGVECALLAAITRRGGRVPALGPLLHELNLSRWYARAMLIRMEKRGLVRLSQPNGPRSDLIIESLAYLLECEP